MQIRFTQIITCYNQQEDLPRAVGSVLDQSVLPDEIIIGDDASTDASPELISDYSRQYPDLIRPVFAEVNGGVACNINRCIGASRADMVSILAADDWILPGKFEAEFEIARRFWPEYGVVYSNSVVEYPETGKTKKWRNRKPEGDVLSELIRRRFRMRNFWYSKKLWEEIGGYDEELQQYEDWKIKLELALRTQFKFCPGYYSIYNVTSSGIHARPPAVHLEAIRHIHDDILSKYDLDRVGIRQFDAVVSHYEMLAFSGLLMKARLGLKAIAKDRAWLKPHAEVVKRWIVRGLQTDRDDIR